MLRHPVGPTSTRWPLASASGRLEEAAFAPPQFLGTPPPRPSYPPRPHRWFGEDARLSSKAATVICPVPAFRADRLKGCSKLRSPSQRQPSGLLRPSFLLSSFLASIPLSGKAAFPNCTLTPCTYFPGSLEPPFYHKPCPSLSPSSSAPRLGCIQQTYFMC